MNLLRLCFLLFTALSGCGTDDTASMDPERPPTTAAEMTSWLESGAYLGWACESEAHAARSPSPHGSNRICSNAVLSAHGTGEFPIDAASVKEIYQGENIVGFAVYRKVTAGAGDAFYWYERVGNNV